MLSHDRAWWTLVMAIAVASCGGDDFEGTGGQSGSSGSAGRGGAAGIAGTSGAAGSAGAVGSGGAGGSSGAGAGGMDAGDGSMGSAGDASAGAGGMGGSGGAPQREALAYVLWGKADTARIVTLDKASGAKVGDYTLSMTAERGTGWTARDLDALRDGTRRLLWTRPELGETLVWVLDHDMKRVSEIPNTASEPRQGWFSVSYARLADDTGRLVWFNRSASTAVVWPLTAGDVYSGGTKKNYTQALGSRQSASPVSYAQAPDGTARLLWATDGADAGAGGGASVWHLDPLEDRAVEKTISLPAGTSAKSITVMEGGRVRFGIGNDAANTGLVCTFGSDAELTSIAPAAMNTEQGWDDGECQTLGPEAGFAFVGYTVEDCPPGRCPAPCVDQDRLPHLPSAPARLSATGLFADNTTRAISPRALPYKPAYELWSDGAAKTRHAYIPACAKVNTGDMDHWSMPVGARFWKEFQRNGVLVETRLIHRFGPGADDWIFASYQWPLNDGNGDATLVPAATGVQNANGTPHDIPNEAQCKNCHTKLSERILSFSAIQLSHAGPGQTMATLSSAGRLTVPNASGFAVPGTADQKAALGYLHANCGNCHNASFPGTTFRMRLLVAHTSVTATDAYTTGINVPTTTYTCNGAGVGMCDRIEPRNTALSAVSQRMGSRVPATQMPPIGTELVHAEGAAAVNAWINGL